MTKIARMNPVMLGLDKEPPPRAVGTKVVAVNERGLAIGEDHPRAILKNSEVDLLLELREEGYSYGWLALKFEISKSTVRGYCTGEIRAQYAAGYRRQRRRER